MATKKAHTSTTSSSSKSSGGSSKRTTRASTRSAGHKAAPKARKSAAKKTSHCWPGFEPVPGKTPGAKGSCKPKAHQTSSEKKGDSKAAAARKLSKQH